MGSYELGSLGRFQSAQSSFSSYSTAPSLPRQQIKSLSAGSTHSETVIQKIKSGIETVNEESSLPILRQYCGLHIGEILGYEKLIRSILDTIASAHELRDFCSEDAYFVLRDHLTPLLRIKHRPNTVIKELTDDIQDWITITYSERTGLHVDPSRLANTKRQIFDALHDFCSTWRRGQNGVIPEATFSSEWLLHLRSRGIILDSRDELDWSGIGQHVEYAPEEEDKIPLILERTIGHSMTAVIESVRCRRIRLACKKIRCTRQLTKESAVTEVEHLQRLQHFHIVRVVGTYTLKRTLGILLYPVAHGNLADYMDNVWTHQGDNSNATIILGLGTFVGCLSTAIEHIHMHNVKHMDIKPQNLLVRLNANGLQKIYIADFGIARSYKNAADAETDSPVSFTRAYAAPEVLQQNSSNATRGFKADIYSLGCVFIEILATMMSSAEHNERDSLQEIRSRLPDTSFHAHMAKILPWLEELVASSRMSVIIRKIYHPLLDAYPAMVQETAEKRPTAAALAANLCQLGCKSCDKGPEPFAAAEDTTGSRIVWHP